MAAESPTKGDWVGWVGTYDDIVHSRPGQYRVRLMDNHNEWDTAYPGLELLPDGTLVTTTYGYFIEGEEPFIVSVRFKMEELDEIPTVVDAVEPPAVSASCWPVSPTWRKVSTSSRTPSTP